MRINKKESEEMEGLKIEEVAFRVGVSTQTLNRWYKFKKDNPKDSTSKLIPAYRKIKTEYGFVRIWQMSDIQKLIDFKAHMVYGRCGKMSQYKGKGTKNGKNKSGRKEVNT